MYALAHDLRSPLTNVIGITRIMRQQGNLSPDQLKWIDFIESSSQNSNSLVNELLQSNELMSKPENLELIDLKKLLEEVVLMAQIKSVDKNIAFEFIKTEENCQVLMEHLKMQRLFTNLVNNAVKFSHESGQIIVSIDKKDKYFVVSVKDFGIGISDKNLPFIFDPFTKAKRKGTSNETSYGLGLSISKQIAEQHGGTIQVLSKLGEGTEFIVSLSLVRA
jgi:two-component system, OmpR family, sensor histidine kinase VicK